MSEEKIKLRGVLHFFSETGTEGGYWAFQDERYMSPDGRTWSYDGLHILASGDQLTIFDKKNPRKIVWSGIIKLKPHQLFTQDASGLWIHADQKGTDRRTWARWFFDEYPAELIANQRGAKR